MQPLQGITVVALEQAVAAPFATRQLADLGARVIKVERPGGGDFARGYDQRVSGLSSHFVWTNRSKESLTLDLKQPAAAEVLLRLIRAKADVERAVYAPPNRIIELSTTERFFRGGLRRILEIRDRHCQHPGCR